MIKRTLCFNSPAYLSLKNNQLVIKIPDAEAALADVIKCESTRTIPIEDIGVVILDNRRITITQGLLDALLNNNCAVITCDSRNMPIGLLLPLASNSIQHERFCSQLSASTSLRKQLWMQTIRAKIENQTAMLRKYSQQETKCMDVWAEQVKSGDPQNLEGRAAAYYWKHIFQPYIDHFVRDREGEFPNSLLNYGYAIIRAIIARALVGSGLLPTMGIHHHNRYNAYCLADDIMEPYRPYVDEIVLDIVKDNPNEEHITPEIKRKLLSLPTKEVFINGKRSPLMVAATTTAASLVRCFSGEMRKISYPIFR